MKRFCFVAIAAALLSIGWSDARALTEREIEQRLLILAYQGAKEMGLNDLQRGRTRVVDVRIRRLTGERYRAMADIRCYSKRFGAYHIAVYQNDDGRRSGKRAGYVVASYVHGVAVGDYEAALATVYPGWLESGGPSPGRR